MMPIAGIAHVLISCIKTLTQNKVGFVFEAHIRGLLIAELKPVYSLDG